MSNEVLPKHLHRERVREIARTVPKTHQSWIKDKLAHSNEPSLRQRLEELRLKAFSIVRVLPIDLAVKAADTRNYLTHYSRHSRNVAFGQDLYWLSEQVRILLYGCLLLDMGVDSDTGWAWLRQSRSVRALQWVD